MLTERESMRLNERYIYLIIAMTHHDLGVNTGVFGLGMVTESKRNLGGKESIRAAKRA